MKVALIQPPVWWTSDAPLGLAQIAGCAKHHGHDVRVFDLNMQLWLRRGRNYENLWNWEQFQHWNDPEFVARFFRQNSAYLEGFVEDVLRTDARVIGFSVYHGSHVAALQLARMFKAADPKRLVVMGGQYFFKGDKAKQMLADPAVDAAFSGAADESFPAFLKALDAAGRPEPAPGVSVRTAAGIRDGGPPAALQDLDRTPFADFTGFPMESYVFNDRLPFNASRGCIWHCRFCSTREFWPGYGYMSGARIVAEMLHQMSLFPALRHFEFYDITFNGNMKSVVDLSELLDQNLRTKDHYSFGFKINAVLRPEMTPALLGRLHHVGLMDVIYGVESGSPRVLKQMNKHFTIETAEKVLRDTRAAGIKTTANFMFGFPGETEEDFQMTLDFLRRNAGSLDRAYASATFTSLEEYSYLTDNLPEFGVPAAAKDEHNLYWQTADGSNDYLVRQGRYERFRKLAIELNVDAYKGVNGTVEQDRRNNLAQYHRFKGEHFVAIDNLLGYLELDFYSEPMRNELAGYRRDLERLLAAERIVRGANALARRGGDASRRFANARALLDGMRDKAELRGKEDGSQALFWGREAISDRPRLESLLRRADLFLDIAAAEIRSGEAERPAPECAR